MYLVWSSPSNNAPEDFSHLVVHVSGVHDIVANETRNVNENLTMTVYRLCSCGSRNISISAVNRCGRSGRSVLITVDDQLPRPQLTTQCHMHGSLRTTTMESSQSMHVYTHMHTHTLICMPYLEIDGL